MPTAIGPPRSGRVMLDYTADGQTLKVTPNTIIELRLAYRPFHWSEPISSDARFVVRESSHQQQDGAATATFHAVSPGTAMLTADGSLGGHLGGTGWVVTIIVVG